MKACQGSSRIGCRICRKAGEYGYAIWSVQFEFRYGFDEAGHPVAPSVHPGRQGRLAPRLGEVDDAEPGDGEGDQPGDDDDRHAAPGERDRPLVRTAQLLSSALAPAGHASTGPRTGSRRPGDPGPGAGRIRQAREEPRARGGARGPLDDRAAGRTARPRGHVRPARAGSPIPRRRDARAPRSAARSVRAASSAASPCSAPSPSAARRAAAVEAAAPRSAADSATLPGGPVPDHERRRGPRERRDEGRGSAGRLASSAGARRRPGGDPGKTTRRSHA